MNILLNLLVVAAVLATSVLLGIELARRWRMPDYSWKIAVILFSILAAGWVAYSGKAKLGIDLRGGAKLTYRVQPPEGSEKVEMEDLVRALKRRVDPANVKEVSIHARGADRVEIIIPEVEAEEVRSLERILQTVGTLEFRILATEKVNKSLIERARALKEGNKLTDSENRELARWVPIHPEAAKDYGPDIATRVVEVPNDKEGPATVPQTQVLVVIDPHNVRGDFLTQAQAEPDPESGDFRVAFVFNSTGAARFERLTGDHRPDPDQDLRYHLGIILDGYLRSAPYLKQKISSHGVITGNFKQEQATELAKILKAGKLPATLLPDQDVTTIGASLGQDTIRRGVTSLVVALALVFAFVLVYYRFAGLVAALALLMNGLLLYAIMILIGAAFTLPGLAGFALTVAMAVDANVLIYERMREEAARGATMRMTIRNGFDRALSAIVDSNLTTLITAVVLYTVGSDQVRGFAVPLFLGIVLSMFTAIFCARVVFDVAEKQRWLTQLRMLRALGETQINFLKYKWIFLSISVGLILVGMAALYARGRGILDIDFTGGVSLEVVFNEPQDIGYVRQTLEELGLPDLTVQETGIGSETRGTRFLVNTSKPADIPDDKVKVYVREVQDRFQNVFGDKLARNNMTVTWPGTGAPPSPKTSGMLPRGAPAVMGVASLLLGQSNPPKTDAARPETPKPEEPKPAVSEAKKPEEPKPAPSDAKKPEAPKPAAGEAKKPEEPKPAAAEAKKPEAPKPLAGPAEKPEAPKPPATIKAVVTLKDPMNHDVLTTLLTDSLQSLDLPASAVFAVVNPKEREKKSSRTWEVDLALPAADAQRLLKDVAQKVNTSPYFPNSDSIGGDVARDTRRRAGWALLAATVSILLYLWIRFQRVSYGLGAVLSLAHDTLLAIGAIALSYWIAPYFGWLMVDPFKINMTVTVALLTLAGYSLNDTIVVFDRIREVRGKAPRVTEEMVNLSINQMLGRTLITSLIELTVITILYFFGGPTIHGFSFAIIVGVLTGTYSSIYVASPVLLWIAGAAEDPKAAARAEANQRR